MPGFLDDQAVSNQLQADLGATNATIAPRWSQVVTSANLTAWNRIQETFLERGFTAAQILTWDNGPTYQMKIALYLALTEGGNLHTNTIDPVYIESCKWYFDKLPDALLVAGGAIN
jgi:hypothetical protein